MLHTWFSTTQGWSNKNELCQWTYYFLLHIFYLDFSEISSTLIILAKKDGHNNIRFLYQFIGDPLLKLCFGMAYLGLDKQIADNWDTYQLQIRKLLDIIMTWIDIIMQQNHEYLYIS